MVNVTYSTQSSNIRTSSAASTPSAQSTTVQSGLAVSASTVQQGVPRTVSSLARQLGDAAVRAEARDASLSRKALGEKAAAVLEQVTGGSFAANKVKNDAQVPLTDDPELLARARQATEFVNSSGSGKNPFKGMSTEQLALIIYDESGDFTVNERRSAWLESYDQRQVWKQQAVHKAMNEYNQTGKLTNFFGEVLEYYKGLPAIEQAQYPDDYASKLQGWIDLDFNYMTHQAEGKGAPPTDLIKQLLSIDSNTRNAEESSEVAKSMDAIWSAPQHK